MPPNVVHVLEEDPHLADALDDADRAIASQHLVAAEVRLARGPWAVEHPLGRSAGDLGYLVLDGLLLRETALGRHTTAEILGEGDVLRPWDDHEGEPSIAVTTSWRVLQPTRLAVLDARFTALCSRLPTVNAELVSRTLRRARLLALLLALSAMPRLDARLLALLWHLADRWGTVAPEGTHVPLPLTHAMLARLVGAQRPSVTSALRTLEDRGLLRRFADGSGYLLIGDPPADVAQALSETAA